MICCALAEGAVDSWPTHLLPALSSSIFHVRVGKITSALRAYNFAWRNGRNWKLIICGAPVAPLNRSMNSRSHEHETRRVRSVKNHPPPPPPPEHPSRAGVTRKLRYSPMSSLMRATCEHCTGTGAGVQLLHETD